MSNRFLYSFFFWFIHLSFSYAQVDDTKAAFQQLDLNRQALKKESQSSGSSPNFTHLQKMLKVGLWDEVVQQLQQGTSLKAAEQKVLWAQYFWLHNDFYKAQQYTDLVLQEDPNNQAALAMQATLLIEAWKLQEAVDLCKKLRRQFTGDTEIALTLGRALLLQRAYSQALTLAKELQQEHPDLGSAYLLEADVYFWDQQPEKATPLIKKALELDPFNADARFSYGYAIWRRVDATQLNQMAAQWELALAINPLHFQTHWHWGNGHTNRTYADYADPDEEEIRTALAGADSLVQRNQLEAALDLTQKLIKQFPSSVLPAMHRASIYYSDFDSPIRSQHLDSAESIFRQVLQRKPHYGPAHNGLSAVIKSKRIPYLSSYDSISTVLKKVDIKNLSQLIAVFPDVAYYPGDLAKAMVWNQLYTSVVYFPFLSKQQNTFVIPPLHQDLAIAMKRPFFRFSTTFDNRQWMDIRGVGSGAAAIEYVERGAYQERNVLLHEYVHLFHGRVLTDAENRRIRWLYYHAMENNLTLDYYSQNNESEYFAQTYPAYFETMKVHPLDFKSMNTQSALQAKDSAMYLFLDSLVKKERRYLAGDQTAMSDNWAEVYINLSQQSKDPVLATKLLDTALLYGKTYQPAYLAYAQQLIKQENWEQALRFIKKAEKINPNYAPIYQSYAEWEAKRSGAERDQGVEKQARWLKKAFALEPDYQQQAYITGTLRTVYNEQAQINLAIQTAEQYVQKGAELSTYLRDKKDENKMYVWVQRALVGDTSQLAAIDRLAQQKPQHFDLQLTYAQALTANKRFDLSNTVLLKAQKILASNRQRRMDFDLAIASNYLGLDQVDSVGHYLELVEADKLDAENQQYFVQLLLSLDRIEEAKGVYQNIIDPQTPRYLAIKGYTDGCLLEKRGLLDEARASYQASLQYNPYYKPAYEHLLRLYEKQKDKKAAEQLTSQQRALWNQL